MKNHKTIAICSGYFNPLHKGHVDYLSNAKELCDELIVIKKSANTSFRLLGALIRRLYQKTQTEVCAIRCFLYLTQLRQIV